MWKIIFLSLFLFNWGIFQPELPKDIEKIDMNLLENEISFTFFDLVNGECTLIQSPDGEKILLNTGAGESEEELMYYLDIYGVEEITAILLTSEEPEYIGNLESLLSHYSVKTVILPQSLASVKLSGNSKQWTKGTQEQLVKDLNIKVLHESSSKDEHLGMDILFEFKETYLLYMTSANKQIEKKLMEENNLSVVNILKVGDFGNKKGTSQSFLTQCDPQIAILFKKANNNGVMDVLERLHETWIDIYQTRQVGNISIKMKEKDYQVIIITLNSFHQFP